MGEGWRERFTVFFEPAMRGLDAARRRVAAPPGTAPRGEARLALLPLVRDVSGSVGLEIQAGGRATLWAKEGVVALDEGEPGGTGGSESGEDGVAEPQRVEIDREKPLHRQFSQRFDYIVLSDVLSRQPEPIGYLQDLVDMLRPGGHLLISVSDKRRTGDARRPSTRLEELLDAFHRSARHPSLQQLLESARAESNVVKALARRDPRAYYTFGLERMSRPPEDARWHVWTDDEFLAQLVWLTRGRFLGPVSIQHFEPTGASDSAFHVILQREESLALDPEGKLIRAPRAATFDLHIFYVEEGQRRWIRTPGACRAIGMEEEPLWLVSERVLDAIPLGDPLELVDEDDADADEPRWRGAPPAAVTLVRKAERARDESPRRPSPPSPHGS